MSTAINNIWQSGNRYYYFSRLAMRTMPLPKLKALALIADGTAELIAKPQFAADAA
jgi:hypothetical protein